MRASGHPEAPALAEELAAFVASGMPRVIDQVFQMKVAVARWRPPIWRRVLLPATATLGDLRRTIQVLFGWDGEHLQAFTVGRDRCSDPFYTVEKSLPRDPARTCPVRTAFKGDSPVEYFPTEPEPFDLAEANRRLSG